MANHTIIFLATLWGSITLLNPKTPASPITVNPNSIAGIKGDFVNLRETPDLSSPVLMQLHTGNHVTIIRKGKKQRIGNHENHWYEVKVRNRLHGFIFGEFLHISDTGCKNTIVFIIGIDDYADELNNQGITDLPNSIGPKEVYKFYCSPSGGSVHPLDLVILRNENATISSIEQELSHKLSATNKNREFILYFSGHGNSDGVLLHDSFLPFSEISHILEENQVHSALWINDSCHSGGIKNIGSLSSSTSDYRSPSFTLISSSRTEEYSWYYSGFQMGVFTNFWLEGLHGTSDKNSDMIVDLDEAFTYTQDKVRAFSSKQLGYEQIPWIGGVVDFNKPISTIPAN